MVRSTQTKQRPYSLYVILAGIVIGCCASLTVAATTAPPPPGTPPVLLTLSVPSIELKQQKEDSVLQAAAPVDVAVGSFLTQWRVSAVATDAQGPDGARVKARDIYMIPLSIPGTPTMAYTGQPVSLGEPRVVASGVNTEQKIVGVNGLLFRTALDPMAPPGEYKGQIRFILEGRGLEPTPGPTLNFTLCHDPFVSISLEPDAMQFGSLVPGEHDANNQVKLSVSTNIRKLEVNISLTQLNQNTGSGIVPRSALVLAGGESAQKAVHNAHSVKFGSTDFVWKPDCGQSSLFLAGRADITMDLTPGDYRGIIHVDYHAPSGG